MPAKTKPKRPGAAATPDAATALPLDATMPYKTTLALFKAKAVVETPLIPPCKILSDIESTTSSLVFPFAISFKNYSRKFTKNKTISFLVGAFFD